MNLLISYLTDRAKEEGVKMLLDETFFNQYYRAGCRTFFGITIDDDKNLLYDAQEPRVDFLKHWLQNHRNNIDNITSDLKV